MKISLFCLIAGFSFSRILLGQTISADSGSDRVPLKADVQQDQKTLASALGACSYIPEDTSVLTMKGASCSGFSNICNMTARCVQPVGDGTFSANVTGTCLVTEAKCPDSPIDCLAKNQFSGIVSGLKVAVPAGSTMLQSTEGQK